MTNFRQRPCLLLLVAFIFARASTLHAGVPTPAELVALAPRFASDGAEPRSFHVSGTMSAGKLNLGYEVTWQKAGRCAVCIFDASNQTPLFWVVDGHALVYDVPDNTVETVDKCAVLFVAERVQENLNFNFGLRDADAGAESIVIDLKSMLAAANVDPSVEPLESGGYQLTTSSARATRLIAEVDPTRTTPFASLRIHAKDDLVHPAFVFEKIKAGQVENPATFRFPSRKSLEASVTVRDLVVDKARPAMANAMVAFACRVAIRNPDLRKEWERDPSTKIDWTAAAERDAKTSAALRQAMKDAPTLAESAK